MSKVVKIAPGLYRHYKGPLYQVYQIATHTETSEKFVVYRSMYGERRCWVRPYEMFIENIEYEGKTVKRFTYTRDNRDI